MITNNPANFNPNQLTTPGLYVVIQPPPGYIQAQASNYIAYFGTGSWGKANTAMLCGSMAEVVASVGSKTTASYADPFDLPTACEIAFAQTQTENAGLPAGIGVYVTRVTDGTDVAASGFMLDTTGGSPLHGLKLTAVCTGTLGNGIVTTVSPGQLTGTFNAYIVPPAGLQPELYTNILGGGAGVFWQNLANVINNGQGVLRGPSRLVTASNVNAMAINPAVTPMTLASGTDGRSGVTSSNFIGSSTADPPTGIYQMTVMDPAPSVAVCVGNTDNTVFPTIQSLIDSLAIFTLFSFPTGTDIPTAVAATKSLGINTPNAAYCKDWVYWYDQLTGQQKLVDPAVFIGARIASLSPENSPLNKAVYQVIGTERINSLNSYRNQYSPTDIGTLQSSGILVITNNPPGGNYWGLPHGSNCCSDLVRHWIEYSRLTNWIAHTLDSEMGIYLGQNQSEQSDDPLRAQVKLTLDDFFQTLKGQRQIDNFKTVCDLTDNNPQSIAQHFMYAGCYVRYLSSVQFFVINLQGGTTVNITVSTITEQQAAQIGV